MPRPDADDLMRHVRAARKAARIASTQDSEPEIQDLEPETLPQSHAPMPSKAPVDLTPPEQGVPTPPDLQHHAFVDSRGVQYNDREHRNLPLQPPHSEPSSSVQPRDGVSGTSSGSTSSVGAPGFSYIRTARNIGLGLGGCAAAYYGGKYLHRRMDHFLRTLKDYHASTKAPAEEVKKADAEALKEFKDPTPPAPVKVVEQNGAAVAVPVRPINLTFARMPSYL